MQKQTILAALAIPAVLAAVTIWIQIVTSRPAQAASANASET